jgi:LPXTG-motif cell wall-anchored protein
VVEVAPPAAEPAPVAVETPAPAAEPAPAPEPVSTPVAEPTELPKTASSLPLIALIGVTSLGLAIGLKRFSS